jgi:pimeloyl-ACP methyl ester carboxylesterase
MPFVTANGIRLAYERAGSGPPVLLIMGSNAAGRVWTVHQTRALHRAGFSTIIFDNRGIAPSDAPPGRYTLDDMVADTAGLIEALGLAPCHVVGTSLGAWIGQQLALERPAAVRSLVMLGTRGRSDVFRRALTRAERDLALSEAVIPPSYGAAMAVLRMLSPATLADDAAVGPILEIFELSGASNVSAGQSWVDSGEDLLDDLAGIRVPSRVVAFTDDLITPAHLAAEVAKRIPGCDYVEIPAAGHLGFLERPDDVNSAIIEFLAGV